jgi:hypothetical protein
MSLNDTSINKSSKCVRPLVTNAWVVKNNRAGYVGDDDYSGVTW